MMLISHIAIALLSIVFTAYVYFAPSKSKLRTSYILAALTVASGTWLVVSNPAHMVQACTSGLAYLAITFVGIALARNKLAAARK